MNSQINQTVGLQLGRLGIPAGPGLPTGPGFGIGMNPDQALFVMTMANVALSRGDPPGTVGMDQLAEAVLKGQVDPIQALIVCAPEFARPQLVYGIQALQLTGMVQMLQIIRISGLIQAAASMPRQRIQPFLSETAGASGH